MPKTELTISTLVETPDLLVRRGSADGQTGVPLVIFSCAHKTAVSGDWLEFYGAAAQTGRPVVWVTDKARSWYGARGLAADACTAIESELARLGAEQVDALGGSMGGFGVLAFGRRLPVRRALAFTPRFSADPIRVRDFRLRDHLMTFRETTPFPDLSDCLGGPENTLILHGDKGVDLLQITAFPDLPNVMHHILGNSAHDVAPTLRRQQRLWPVIQAVLDGDWAELDGQLAALETSPLSKRRAELLLKRDDWIENRRRKAEAEANVPWTTRVKRAIRRRLPPNGPAATPATEPESAQ